MQIPGVTIGLDLTKHWFQAHGVGAAGNAILRKRLKRLPWRHRAVPCRRGGLRLVSLLGSGDRTLRAHASAHAAGLPEAPCQTRQERRGRCRATTPPPQSAESGRWRARSLPSCCASARHGAREARARRRRCALLRWLRMARCLLVKQADVRAGVRRAKPRTNSNTTKGDKIPKKQSKILKCVKRNSFCRLIANYMHNISYD